MTSLTVTTTTFRGNHTADKACPVCHKLGCSECTGVVLKVSTVPSFKIPREDMRMAMYLGGIDIDQGSCGCAILPAVRRTLESSLGSIDISDALDIGPSDVPRVRNAMQKLLIVVAYAEHHKEDVVWK